LELFEEHMINMSLTPRPLRCIQIDLTTFGVGTLRLGYLLMTIDSF